MWLVVTGQGSWNYAGKPYRPGVHEIDKDVAEAAVGSRIRSLFVTDYEPEIMRTPDSFEPLSLKDIRVGTNHGVRLHTDEPVAEVADSEGRIYEFPCPYCTKAHASSGSLARHVEMNHELLHA
jgi:hypothetical protein